MSTPEGLTLTKFPKRPGLGKKGKEIRVRTNFFPVKSFPDGNLIHYDVTITPDVFPSLNRKVFKRFEEENRDKVFDGTWPVYDGRKNLYSNTSFNFGDSATFEVTLPDEDESAASRRPPRPFTVKFHKVAVINMEELNRFINAKHQFTNNCQTGIQALDILIRYLPSIQYTPVGRSFFISEGSQLLGGGAEVWQGYFQSVRPTYGKFLVNIDVSATAFYESGPLINIIIRVLGRNSPEDLRKGIIPRERIKLDKFLKDLRFRVTHRPEAANKRFKYTKLSEKSAAEVMFDHEGQNISVKTYYKNRYNLNLVYHYLPCVIVKKDIFIPLEVCHVCPGQRMMRKLSDDQTKEMIKFTCQPPSVRANRIKKGLDLLNYQRNKYLANFGMQISNEMMTIKARELLSPKLQFHPSSKEARLNPRDATWNSVGKKATIGGTLTSWGVLVFAPDRQNTSRASIEKFIRELVNVCQDRGMNITNPKPEIVHASSQANVENSLRQIYQKAGNQVNTKPQLIMCVLTSPRHDIYKDIKRIGEMTLGVVTQCVVANKIMGARDQYYANVCLKMNVKIGGTNQTLAPEQIPFIEKAPTVVMGADVVHPPQGTTGKPSIASVCASIDRHATRYAAAIRRQTSRQETIDDLKGMVKELLKTFYKSTSRKPERILFYRDGIGEGHFHEALEVEVKAIQTACEEMEKSYKPLLTYVVVQKRHHARFFPIDKDKADKSGNCRAGTVVETDITHPFEFDFYLQSHSGLKGTSRSAHYHVIYDQNNFKPDDLQELSYNLCYVYARATRAVSIVPPVYYADLVCDRARHYIPGWSDSSESSEASTTSDVSTGSAEIKVAGDLSKMMYFM